MSVNIDNNTIVIAAHYNFDTCLTYMHTSTANMYSLETKLIPINTGYFSKFG